MNSKRVGELAEAKVLAAVLARGYSVLLPWGDNQRYDLVIERDGKFERIQCKNATMSSDGSNVVFKLYSSSVHRGGVRKPYKEEAEFFGVYAPELDRCFLVPTNELGNSEGRLRLTPPLTRKGATYKWAKDYEL